MNIEAAAEKIRKDQELKSMNAKALGKKAKEEENKRFLNLLQKKMTALDFKNLPSILGTTGYARTLILNNIRNCAIEFLETFSKITEKSKIDLVLDYKLGANNITATNLCDWAIEEDWKIQALPF